MSATGPERIDPEALDASQLDHVATLLELDRHDVLTAHRVVLLGDLAAVEAGAVTIRDPQGWSVVAAVSPTGQAGDEAACVDVAIHDLSPDHGPVHIWLGPRTPALAQRSDEGAVRTLLELRVELPLDQRSDIATRSFRPGDDDRAWLRVNNRAFAWHPEQGGWGPDDLALRIAQPWFDPDGFLVHERDGELAGFCWTRLHTEPDLKGEIYVIGVDPDHQGHGLGRQLTLAGYDHLAGRGVSTGSLWVEADNEAALALYRSLGMIEHQRRTALVR